MPDLNERLTTSNSASIYAGVLILSVIVTFAYKLRADGIFACQADHYSNKMFLAYCNSVSYGDYDHGATWFNLENDVTQGAKNADVLFLGSSRMQFAFSAQATKNWFNDAQASYYLLGFSHSENMEFFTPLLERIKPKASIYIINVDRFFDDRISPPYEDIRGTIDAMDQYNKKRMWQRPHKMLCEAFKGLCGESLAFYRDRRDGSWMFSGSADLRATGTSEAALNPETDLEYQIARARAFVRQLPVEPGCVLLTLAPYENTKINEARIIAKGLNKTLIYPKAETLKTFDASHLDPPSAEEWAAEFFNIASAQISKCLNSQGNRASS
ncbi:MAG: hypothetical protein OEU86_03665 [Gammaproteobacteria bacterium]|nr:hypothetical protein [Gammaproteobacteria bacterium]